ncbi:MAG: SpoIIE family protein phosphatase, partial [Bdellovibrionales bacterium]
APATLLIPEDSVSKSHAKFNLDGEQVTITDLGATNKTWVNEHRLVPHQPRVLANNDLIKAGNLIFKFLQKGLLSETSEKARMQGELETAKSIQATFFPLQNEAQFESLLIGGRYRSASECCGDWWWYWSCGGKAFVIVADATGHGASAALVTTAARSAIASIEDDPAVTAEKIYTTLSRALSKISAGAMSMSGNIIEVDFARGKWRYINASHPPAVLFPAGGNSLDWKAMNFVTEILSPPFGNMDCTPSIGEVDIQPGTRLVLLTDGLTERTDTAGKMVRERVFNTILIEAFNGTSNQSAFLDQVIKLSDEKAGFAPQKDDITLVALDF